MAPEMIPIVKRKTGVRRAHRESGMLDFLPAVLRQQLREDDQSDGVVPSAPPLPLPI